MDIISDLPDNLIRVILEKLPLIEAVATSALSTSWRLRWTSLSALILDQDFYSDVMQSTEDFPLEYANVVNSLVLQHGGSLREFYLFIPIYEQPSCSLFQYSISHVMRSTCLEKLTLEGTNALRLPSSIFSAVNLRHLELGYFQFRPPSWFEGFPKLTCFVLGAGATTIDTISNFVSVCPRLEKIRLLCVHFDELYRDPNIQLNLIAPKLIILRVHGKFMHISVSNAQILERISILYCSLPEVDLSRSSDQFKFINNSLQLQHVIFTGRFCKFLGTCSVIHMLPRFDRMKTLEFEGMTLQDPDELHCIMRFLARSPNVRKLLLKIDKYEMAQAADPLESESVVEKYLNYNLGELVQVDIIGFSGTKTEMKIVELLLRFSPILELMCIDCNPKLAENIELQFDKAMENFYQASTKATVRFTF